jgi:hypothetical protein
MFPYQSHNSAVGSIEHIIFPKPALKPKIPDPENPFNNRLFGGMGTLAAVAAVTRAIQELPNFGVKLVGYNGLMLVGGVIAFVICN